MMNKNWTILIFLAFLMGCAPQQQPAPRMTKGRKFFTPQNWQQPIKNQKPVQQKIATTIDTNPAAAQPVAPPTGDKFKPDFTKKVVAPVAVKPTGTVANTDGFQPNFAAPTNPAVTAAHSAAVSAESREQMIGYASWYGPGFHGKKTANGERYNQNQMTAAHRILPMNTWVQVSNLENNKVAVVRINDRGPYKKNRIIDLTKKAAAKLGFHDKGTAHVSLKVLQYPKNYDPSKGLNPYKQVVVQVAVFKGEERAHSFQRKLSQRYQSISFQIDDHKKEIFHVIAGPYEQRAQALKIASVLKADGIDNFVRSYRK